MKMNKIEIEPLEAETEEVEEIKKVKKPKAEKKDNIETMKEGNRSLSDELKELKELLEAQTQLELIRAKKDLMYNALYKKEEKVDNTEYTEPKEIPKMQFKPQPLPVVQSNQMFRQPENKKRKFGFLKLLLYPLIFIVSSAIAYSVIHFFFEADITTELGITISTGIIVTALVGVLVFINKIFKNKANSSSQFSNETPNIDLADITKCPNCNGKVAKSQVFFDGRNYKQIVKCLNPVCDFKKELGSEI
jgi:hypothetical protein